MTKPSKLDLARVCYRSLYIQAAWTYELMLGLGYCFCMIPFVKKKLPSDEYAGFVSQHLEFYNTHPYMAGCLLGAQIRLEETKPGDPKNVRFKKVMSQSAAAIGDPLFWGLLKPAAGVLGVVIASYWGLYGVTVFFILYNIPHFYVRIKGVYEGYSLGEKVTQVLTLRRFEPLIKKVRKTGLAIAGGACACVLFSPILQMSVLNIVGFGFGLVSALFLLNRKIDISIILMLLIIVSTVVGRLIS